MGNFIEKQNSTDNSTDNSNELKFGGYKNTSNPRPGYYKTPSEVYYRGELILNAKPSTFKKLGSGWAKDDKHVYFQGKIIEGIHNPTFIVQGKIARDKKSKWYRGKKVT